ncbi:uncharacterized protein LOC111269673 isoform X1 [Varroa jacobsoni]|uniref:Uncharacterized protein n=1 Tax=Varroa destructor TaxID=109461 RepID=A0A7M7JF88_VARDE|nr:uncharacterized protein LOC111243755 isoform X2 [Varroa destructor]XP_022705182.1 uncharacterized protein LOC111269673 isoform X1 [Varroa jacobsoni]
MRTTSIRKWLGVAVACVIFLCSGVSSSNAEPGKELDDFEFDDDELEKLPEEDETQAIHYRISKAINDLLQDKVTREELLNPSAILRRPLTDPLVIEDITIDQQDIFNTILASFTNMRVRGLRAVELDKVVANMSGQNVRVEASIPLVEVTGNYNMSANVAMWALEGADKLLLNISDLQFCAEAYFAQTSQGTLEIIDVNATLQAYTIDLHLFGLPSWGGSLINLCSEVIFENIKDGLLEDFRSGFKQRANAELENVKIPLDYQQDERMIDTLLAKTNEHIRAGKNEPLKLPPFTNRMKQDLILMSFQSEMRLIRGVLSGLSSMRRTGDVLAMYANRTLSLIVHFGFDRLIGSYDWYAHMMGVGPSGSAEITVNDIAIQTELSLRLRRRAKFALRSLKVHSIGQIDTKVSGLGSGDPATEIIANFLSYAFRQRLADWVMDGCRASLQKQLDKIQIQILD